MSRRTVTPSRPRASKPRKPNARQRYAVDAAPAPDPEAVTIPVVVEPPAAEPPSPPHVATIISLAALGWHVTEFRPSIGAPVQWRVAIKRHDGAVAIIVLDAADPDAALEELARYAAADAEDDLP